MKAIKVVPKLSFQKYLGSFLEILDAREIFKMQSPSHQLPTQSKSPGGGAEKSAFLKNTKVTQKQTARYLIFLGAAGFWELLTIKQV